MKAVLIELDDRLASELERVAPAKSRSRAQFIRLAIRRALDLALDRETADAYRAIPVPAGPDVLDGWDPANALARPAARPRRTSRRRRAA